MLSNSWIINTSGSVGINSTTPTKTLHVVGTGAVCDTEANCDSASATIGNLYATTRSGGAIDIAEMIKYTGEKPEAGDLLCIAESSSFENKGIVEKCSEEISTLVVGIVTTNPHMVIGQEFKGIDSIEMTIAGRIPVNVVGEVNKGDLLVASSTSGAARTCKSNEDCEGSIIGKSLTNVENGKVIAITTMQ